MKKNLGTLVLFFVSITGLFSLNPCFPNGITFSSQHDIDIYEENNPTCTEITGDVIIEGADIATLAGISIITSINGSLIIRNCPLLTNTAGLLNLTTIGGNFEFINNDIKLNLFGFGALTNIGADLIIQDNNALTTLKGGTIPPFTFPGLQNVTDIGGDILIDLNSALLDLNGLADLVSFNGDIIISENAILNNIEGLDGISNIIKSIQIAENNALASLMGLQNITALTGSLRLENNDLLTDCDGLDGLNSIGDLIVFYNPALISFEGLSNLEINEGILSIQGNTNLQNFNGLNNLTEVGSFIIYNNPSLEEITDLLDLTTIDGGIYFDENNALTSLEGINNIDHTGITELTLTSNSQLRTCDVESICSFLDAGGPAFIDGNANGCATLEEAEDSCSPPKCPQLITPMDGDTDVSPFTELIWHSEDNPNGYILSIGTSPYGNELLDNEDIQLTNSYAYEDGYPCGATIYVRIIAYNQYGESLDCSEADFTIESVGITLISEYFVCPGDSVQLEAMTDAANISWFPQDGLDDPFSFTPIAFPETTTTYVATVSSASQYCTAQSFTDVIVNDAVYTDLYDFTGIMCPGECAATVGALGGGGTPPYTYLWSTGESGIKIFDVCPGPHTVTVTDALGCTDEQEIIVYEYPLIIIELNEIVHVTDSSLGSISLNAYYYSTPHTADIMDPFQWSGVDFEYSSNDIDIDNLSPGCYNLVTFGGDEICSIDTVFCVEDHTTGISELDIDNTLKIYPNPTSSKLYIDIINDQNFDGSISLYTLTGKEIKALNITGKKNSFDISAFKPGLYFIRVVDGENQYFKKLLFMP